MIDADVLGRHRTGDESYVEALLRELPPLADNERLAAVTRRPDLVPEGVEAVELPARSQLLRMTWGLPRVLRRLHPRLAHFLYAVPPGFDGKAIVTVHDVSFEHLPDSMGFRDRLLFRTQVPRSVRRAKRVLTGIGMAARDGTCCVIATHNPEAMVFATRVLTIRDGRTHAETADD